MKDAATTIASAINETSEKFIAGKLTKGTLFRSVGMIADAIGNAKEKGLISSKVAEKLFEQAIALSREVGTAPTVRGPTMAS